MQNKGSAQNGAFGSISKKSAYILHVDGDSFFSSCEVSMRPHLRGRAVVVGKERSIVTAASYEAKKLGVNRGMLVGQVRELVPDAVILASDYMLYRLFSQRMFNILRRYTDSVEHYSIDECFADLTEPVTKHVEELGLVGDAAEDKRVEECDRIGRLIKHDLESELGMTFSIGIAPTKVLAKIGSKKFKPSGFCVVDRREIPSFIENLLVGKIWGIGPSATLELNRHQIQTAEDFRKSDRAFVERAFDKHLKEIWYELNGHPVMDVHAHDTSDSMSSGFGNAGQPRSTTEVDQKSIQRTRTFSPSSSDRKVIYAELSTNVQEACARARKTGLVARGFSFFLKTKDFRYRRIECHLPEPTNIAQDFLKIISQRFDDVYDPKTVFRTTGITLYGLRLESVNQSGLFADTSGEARNRQLKGATQVADSIENKFGEGIIMLASSKSVETLKRKKRSHDALRRPRGAVHAVERKRLYLPEIFLK